MAEPCKHMNFAAKVTVNRLEDTGQFAADVTIKCAECGEPFQFPALAYRKFHPSIYQQIEDDYPDWSKKTGIMA